MKRFALFVLAVALSACGGGGNSSGDTPVPPANTTVATTPVLVNIGDAPADRLVAAAVTIDSVALLRAGGGSAVVMSAPRPMEMMRLMGTVAPLALANVPQGSYTGATVTFGPSTMTYIDPASALPAQRAVPGPMTTTVTFAAPLEVGTRPMVVNFDMDMAASIGMDGAGNVSLTPSLSARHNVAVAGSRDPEDGGMNAIHGVVSGVGTTGFAMTMTQGMAGASLATHSGTHYDGIAGTHMMASSQLLSIDASLQPDGTWMATRVHARAGTGGAMAAGVVTSLAGSPPTQLELVMLDGAGNGMMASNLAGTTTVSIGDATVFAIDVRDVDLAGLPFTPQFDRVTLSQGQRIEAFSAGRMLQGGGMHGMTGGGTLTAATVYLGQQGLRGIVSAYATAGAQSTFVLTLPADSAFAKLAGPTTVTVHQQAGTQLRGVANITNGSVVQARGLLFRDGTAFRLVAGRIHAL